MLGRDDTVEHLTTIIKPNLNTKRVCEGNRNGKRLCEGEKNLYTYTRWNKIRETYRKKW